MLGIKIRLGFYHPRTPTDFKFPAQRKTTHTGWFVIWRRGRDCSAFALPPRKPHPSLCSGPPDGVLREQCSLVEP